MRKWNTLNDLLLLDQVIQTLKSGECLQPGQRFGNNPIDLQGLVFPNISLCKHINLPQSSAARVSGHQEFTGASLRQVNLSKTKLDHSVWIRSSFRDVCFDRASLNSVRCFGCHFENCTFSSTNLRDASFSVAQDGTETTFQSCAFINANFRGASNHNPVFKDVSFTDCNLDGFVFDQPLCERTIFSGNYAELSFRGTPGAKERNRLTLDLRNAQIIWLHANHGLDLTSIEPPTDGSCFVASHRKAAIEWMCDRLLLFLPNAKLLAKVLRGIFSYRSISPLSEDQETFLVSRGMIHELDDSLTDEEAFQAYIILRNAAEEGGYTRFTPIL